MPSITKESISQQAYLLLKNALMTSQFVPGQKLVLRTLAANLKISPTPVREALTKLVSENLLVINARGTVCIPEMTKEKYIEIRDLRVILEGEAAARAAAMATEAELDGLSLIQGRLEAALNYTRYSEALEMNKSFHFELCRCGGSEVLFRIVENLWLQCGPILGRLYENGHRHIEHPHRQLLAALAKRDAEAARLLIGEDIVQGGKPMLDILSRAVS